MEIAESLPVISTTEPLPPGLLFFISQSHYLMPIKLTEQNYQIWKIQCEGALKASSLFEFIQELQPPSPTVVDSTGNSIDNPTFYTWFVVDTHIRSCLIATLTPEVLTQVAHTFTARDLWVFLQHKFGNSNFSEKLDLHQLGTPVVICQICANEGHGALDCSYRFEESSQPANATSASFSPSKTSQLALASDYNANKVFDESPERDPVAIADGPAVSTGNVGSDIVTVSPGMTVLFEPEMSVLNQSDSRFVKDRLELSSEEKFGCPTRLGSGNFDPFQKTPEPQISEAKKRVILMSRPNNKHLGLKRKAPTSPTDGASDPSSFSWKEIRNAYKRFKGCNTIVRVGTPDVQTIQNSQETHVGVNSFQASKQLNSGNSIEHTGTTDDQKIQNSQVIEVEGNSLQFNKQLNDDKAIASMVSVRPGRWICWSRPPLGKVALHFDGSVRHGSAAGGGVFRDHDGLFMAAFSVHLGPGRSNEAEAKALQAGLLFANTHGITVDCIYGDSNEVVQALTAPVFPPRKLRKIKPIIYAIKNVLSVKAVISHTHREGNKVADALAALGHGLPAGSFQSYLSPEQLPEQVKWLLLQDCHDFVYFRPY